MMNTLIEMLSTTINGNNFCMKREDLLPFCLGGNKARKAEKFKQDIIKNKSDIIITYGSGSSNHCRVIANMAKSMNIKCIIVSPIENYKETYNAKLINMFGAEIVKVPVNDVSATIDNLIKEYSKSNTPYFIPGGGHGNLGTAAFVDCYKEIKDYEKESNIYFDYIFLATGTGTTQAGLVCGQYLNSDLDKKIVGISIARNELRGKQVVIDSIREYLNISEEMYKHLVYFIDDYISGGYGNSSEEISSTIKNVLLSDGIALNSTYTGKAYYGMLEYIKKNDIKNKNILFINTGGLPLFFDDMKELIK